MLSRPRPASHLVTRHASPPFSVPQGLSQARASLSPWCLSTAKRLLDLVCAIVLLAVSSPLLLLVAILVRITSPGPALFRQTRVGKDGREFTLLKFRTMTHGRSQAGPGLTSTGDARVTALGKILRKWKLDEFPQLINVARGEMSLVGPRPDLAEFWTALSAEQLRVLCLRPGITGQATLQFRDEEAILAKVPREQLTNYYLTSLLPEKVRLDWQYARRATVFSDLRILVDTLRVIGKPRGSSLQSSQAS